MNIRSVTTAATVAAVLAAGMPVAHAAAHVGSSPAATNRAGPGWTGVIRQSVSIGMDGGWTAAGELDYPAGARGRLPVVVLLHGSGHNDMDQSMPDGQGSTFVPVSQAITRRGYAVLRFNKRGGRS